MREKLICTVKNDFFFIFHESLIFQNNQLIFENYH